MALFGPKSDVFWPEIMFLWTASNLFATIMTRHQKDNVFKLLILLDKLLGWNKIWLSIIWLFGRLAGRKFGNWSQIISCMPFLWKYIYRWWTRTSIFPSGRPVSRYLFCTDLRRVRIMYFNVREAPLKLASPLFGHSGALFFRADLSKFAKSPFWRYISAQSILATLNTLLNTSKCPF